MRAARNAISGRTIVVDCLERLEHVADRLRQVMATHCVVIDSTGRVHGVVSLPQLAAVPPTRIFSDLVPERLPPSVREDVGLSEVSRVIRQTGTDSVLVYDREDRYVGLITGDSLLAQMLEDQVELTHQVEKMAAEQSQSARQLEEAVRRRTLELQSSMQEMEVFSFSLSHDLRAPLLKIGAFASALAEEHGALLPPDGQKSLARIQATADHLVKLVRDIQSFVQVSKDPMPLQRVELGVLVNEVVDYYRAYLDSRSAAVAVSPHMPDVMGHYASLFQVVGNLLYNAAKFTPVGGRPRVVVRTEANAGKVRLSVEDNGIGVPLEFRARLFKPFTRLHASTAYEGTGLGLAFARIAVERMGGRVGFEEGLHGGSRFWIELAGVPPAGLDP